MEARNYFKATKGYFWRWEEEGEVLAIPDSATIAYREYIVSVLEQLACSGLPRFGSLLLSIIATNTNGSSALDKVHELMKMQLGVDIGTGYPLKPAMAFLYILADLPVRYKEGGNRVLLLQTLFENCHNHLSPSKARGIIDYAQALTSERLEETADFSTGNYHSDFWVIALLAKKFPDKETLLEKLAALPLLEEGVNLETPEEPRVTERDFVDLLVENEKTFHVGTLVKRMWSGLQIPHYSCLPAQQPVGGVSDLTNKGSYDRLLISEYAHEDLIFLTRLANGEALYMNREVPPQKNDRERVILIDVSLKSWGTPKTLAYALLLAIARHPKNKIPCTAFAVGQTCTPISFSTVDDLIHSLQVLDPCLHPAAGLEAYFEQNGSKQQRELFLITSKEAAAHPALVNTINRYYQQFDYWIHTEGTGAVNLYKRVQKSRKHIQHMQLPLPELWKRSAVKEEVPLVDGVTAYPLLFPGAGNPKKILETPDGALFMISAERHLFCLKDRNKRKTKGWQLLYENLPFINGEAAVGLTSTGTYQLLLFNIQDRQLVIIDLATKEQKTAQFTDWQNSDYNQFLFHDDSFYFFYKGYPDERYWQITLQQEITIQQYVPIPPDLMEKYREREAQLNRIHYQPFTGGILKNVTRVFINQVHNLVLNIHELRLTDQHVIKLNKSGFLEQQIQATASGKGVFSFPDGSQVIIHRSGMLILSSSNPQIEKVFIPLAIDTSLAAATVTDFAGNAFYQLPDDESRPMNTNQFWQHNIEAFIDNILKHGA